MSLSLFTMQPVPVLSTLWSVAQTPQVSLSVLTPAVTALRQTLDQPGYLGMNPVERARIQTALVNLEQRAAENRDASGFVPRILLQPMIESVEQALPVRLNYRGGDENDIGNDYAIGQEVGQGGCSRVYHGYSLKTGVTVA